MQIVRSLAVLGLVCTLGASSSDGKLATHVHAVHGKVVRVHHDKGMANHGAMTVRTHHAPNANKPAHHTDHHFHVHQSTQFVLVQGKAHTAVTFADVHDGEHLVVHRHADHPHLASKVEIHVRKK